MKKASSKKSLSGKALARVITVGVFLASTVLVAFTVTVFMKTLSSVANARKSDTTKTAKLAGIDGTLLDALLKFHAERTSKAPLDSAALGNPFIALPPVPVAPPTPEPAPAPAVAPVTTTPPATTPAATPPPK